MTKKIQTIKVQLCLLWTCRLSVLLSALSIQLYNLKIGDAFRCLWNETEGAVTTDEFFSIISYLISTEIDNYLLCNFFTVVGTHSK